MQLQTKPINIQPSIISARGSRGGFVLIITIILMAFLVLLMVSMASLTRVETQVAINYQQQDLARQNALLALNIAVGQLQKYAGPDRVTTARADILAATPVNTSNFGGFYTGVWGPTAPTPITDTSNRPSSPLQTWLVSGNEKSPLARTPSDPADPDDLFLVDKAVNQQPSLQVRVRKQPIMATGVPGQAAGAIPVGHFAYWVGDEGVKAKVNVTDPYAKWSATTSGSPTINDQATVSAADQKHRLMSAQRFGIEQVTTDLGGVKFLGSIYDVADSSNANFRRDLGKLLHFNQLSLLPGFASPAKADSIAVNRFHDLTVTSYGLLTNSSEGGLLEDLTWHFENPASTLTGQVGKRNGKIVARAGNTDGVDPLVGYAISWDALRAFYKLADQPRPLEVASPLKNLFGTFERGHKVEGTPAPILVQLRLSFSPVAGTANIKMRVAFVLANPYNCDLRLPNGLCFTFGKAKVHPGSEHPSPLISCPLSITTDDNIDQTKKISLNVLDQLVSGGTTTTTATTNPYIYFLNGSVTLKAGEAQVYTLAGNSSFPSETGRIALQQGMNVTNGVTLNGTWPIPAPDKNKISFSGQITELTNFGGKKTDDYPRIMLRTWKGTTPNILTENALHCASDIAIVAETEPLKQNELYNQADFKVQLNAPMDASTVRNTLARTAFFLNSARSQLNYSCTVDIAKTKISELELGSSTLVTSFSPTDRFSDDLSSITPICWGLSNTLAKGSPTMVAYDVPYRSSTRDAAMMSLAEFQHVTVGATSLQQCSPIGNSVSWTNSFNPGRITDLSFVLNEAIWNRYFFSTVPQKIGGFNPAIDRLPNARYIINPALNRQTLSQNDFTTDEFSPARYLMINGPFNVNSTSIEAWKALLGSTKGLRLNGDTPSGVPFFRTIRQVGSSKNARTLTDPSAWTGYVMLTDGNSTAEVTKLATEIVKQVKLKGPFPTPDTFVNRAIEVPEPVATFYFAGALQKAIVNANINKLPKSSTSELYIGIPGYLTQADILQTIAPVLVTRSDTFTIRAYGDYVNPSTGGPVSRAYCEAVVQRFPEYVDSAANASSDQPAVLNPVNKKFGRRFKIVYFRWLSAADI